MLTKLKGYYIADIFSIIIGLLPILFDIISRKKLTTDTYLTSVILFCVAAVLTNWFSRGEMHREINESHNEINDRLTAMTMVEHCGKAIEARKRLIAGLKSATEVYNVYINTISKPAPAGFDRSDPSEIRNLYASMLQNRGVNWQDIIGGSTARYKERFAGMTLPAKPHANFHCHELAHAYPSVNFTVFGQHGMPKEVMVGFGLHDAEQNDDVFCSRDPRVVGYFESLFKAMQEKTTPVTIGEFIQP